MLTREVFLGSEEEIKGYVKKMMEERERNDEDERGEKRGRERNDEDGK